MLTLNVLKQTIAKANSAKAEFGETIAKANFAKAEFGETTNC